MPIFIFFCLLFILIPFGEIIGTFFSVDPLYNNESLPPYFSALDHADKRHLLNEETYYR
jgi:hypothetical protein